MAKYERLENIDEVLDLLKKDKRIAKDLKEDEKRKNLLECLKYFLAVVDFFTPQKEAKRILIGTFKQFYMHRYNRDPLKFKEFYDDHLEAFERRKHKKLNVRVLECSLEAELEDENEELWKSSPPPSPALPVREPLPSWDNAVRIYEESDRDFI